MSRQYEIIAPIFPGFYNTIYEVPDSFEDSEKEYLENEHGLTGVNYIHWDIKAYENEVATNFVNVLEQHGKDLGILNSFDFIKVISPQYYNYSNDQILAKLVLTDSNIQAINKYLLDNIDDLNKYLQEHHKDRDGYISFICITDFNINWINAENSITCALGFILRHYLERASKGDWEIDLYYDVSEGILPSIDSVDTDYGVFTLEEIFDGKHKEYIKVGE